MSGKEIRLRVESEIVIITDNDVDIDEIVDSIYVEINTDSADLLESFVVSHEIIDSKDINHESI